MQPVIYDVAVSIDGLISGPSGDISRFAHTGPVVDDYFARLAGYGTAIMGRKTYEFGYDFGLEPGQNPYRHMQTLVFSRSIDLPDHSDVKVVRAFEPAEIRALKRSSNGPIYLCGGGTFAAALLAQGLIDRLRLKRAPIVLGNGTPLFAHSTVSVQMTHLETRSYGDGYLFQEYALSYGENFERG